MSTDYVKRVGLIRNTPVDFAFPLFSVDADCFRHEI